MAPAALILAGVVFGMVASSRALDWPSADIKTDDAPIARTGHFTASYANVVKKAAPSVVNISTTKTIKLDPRRQFMSPFEDPMFRRFFGDQFEGRGQAMPRTQKENSLGSGIIVTKDGYIITNNHVVDGADEIKVTLSDKKTELDAKIVGRDPKTDIAIVKINGKDLPFATLANSDQVEVGDVVLAIGSPFGLARSVTMGIVSAMGRGGMGIEAYEDFIQTDAAINPGNSGGALVDAEGRVIGINTAILSRTGGNQGVGFAVPINLAKNVMDSLLKNGRVERGFLGVAIQDITPALAREFKVPESGGALVGDVTEKSAAGEAGIKIGDVIIELNGKTVADRRNLQLIVSQLAPGTKVSVKVLRQGSEKSFDVVLKAMPSEDQASLGSGKPDQDAEESDALNGVTVGDITPGIRQELNLPPRLQGAVITELDPSTPAYEAGLREGDVVVEINHQPVKDAETAVEISKHIKSKQILLRVFSRGGMRFIVVDESKKK